MSEKIIVFGAGATGRGHVGLLAWQSGYPLVFVDKNRDLVDSLRQAGKYKVKLYGEENTELTVSGFRIYHSEDREAIAQEIADSVLVLTAVFDQNLFDVAKTIAVSSIACRKANRTTPLNFIACENMMDSSSILGKYVQSLLSGEDLDYCKQYFGFPDCMISRVVPRPGSNPLLITAEDYNEWTTCAGTFKGIKPASLEPLQLVNNQPARLERKLFIHNGGHAVCGYIGFQRGHRYVHEAVHDPVVAEHVLGALDEIGAVVQYKHGFSPESIDAYKRDLVRRGAVLEMKDEILRVVRDPIRKLSPKERLVAPALLAIDYNLPHSWIVKGITAALRYQHPDDAQSLALSEKIRVRGLPPVLEEICGIQQQSPLAQEIMGLWNTTPLK